MSIGSCFWLKASFSYCSALQQSFCRSLLRSPLRFSSAGCFCSAAQSAPGFWWSLVSAVLGIAAGIVLIRWTISGTVSLTLVLIAFFIVEGIVTLMYAFEHRAQLSGRWGWMLASGIVDLILAGIIFAGLPETATWALGLLVGINLLFGGVAMIGMALAARTAA